MVQANAVSALNALLAMPRPRVRGRNRVARRRPACRQVLKPQSDRADGVAGLGIRDGEGQPNSFGEPAALPVDPLQGLLGCGVRGQAAYEWDVGVVATQRDGEAYVFLSELAQHD